MIGIVLFLLTPVEIQAATEKPTLRLSETTTVVVRVAGPAPVRVQWPKAWLSETSQAEWRLLRVEEPTRGTQTAEREEWLVRLHLSPNLPSEKLELQLAPILVKTGNDPEWVSQTIRAQHFHVTSELPPGIAEPRNLQSFETLVEPPSEGSLWWILLPVGVSLVILLWRYRTLRRRKHSLAMNSKDPFEEFETQENDVLFAHALADRIRATLQSRDQTPALARTTSELTGLAPQEIVRLLENCDDIRFAGKHLSDSERESWLRDAKKFLEAS
jgi:hypothetical protein